MIHWAWLIPAFFGGSIISVVILALLNLSALRESQQEHLQRLMAEYPLPQPQGENQNETETFPEDLMKFGNSHR